MHPVLVPRIILSLEIIIADMASEYSSYETFSSFQLSLLHLFPDPTTIVSYEADT